MLFKKMNGKFLLTILLALTLLLTTACQSNDDITEKSDTKQDEQAEKNSGDSDFPLTADVEGHEVTLEDKPERIAALSLNVAEVVIDLRGPESIIAATDSVEMDHITHISEEAESIDNKIAGTTALDPEEVISYDPDLVLLSLARQGQAAEHDAEEILTNAGLPLASFSNWVTVDDIKNNYQEIGHLVGEEDKANQIVEDIEVKVDQAQEQIQNPENKPSVLLLAQISPNTGPYILGPTSVAYDLIQLAGGESASDSLDLERSTPASVEHIMEIDPDYIVLIEWGPSGSDEFNEFKDSEAFKSLSAVKNDNVKEMKTKDVAQANRFIVDELDDLVHWLNDEES